MTAPERMPIPAVPRNIVLLGMSLPGKALLRLLVAFLCLWNPAVAHAAPEFPALSGRVVDQAAMLDPQTENLLTQKLAAHEQATTDQVVVVTVPELQGYDIADYGYQLGRHWGIGQKGKDNGALLLIAKQEKKIRIEVGYGLEDRLTDAAASFVISRVIAPEFRQGNFSQGIVQGANAMLEILGGKPGAVTANRMRQDQDEKAMPIPFLMFFLFAVIVMFLRGGRGGRSRRGRRAGPLIIGGLGGGGFGGRGGGFGGGGFGGGGGGFGGGGASGGW